MLEIHFFKRIFWTNKLEASGNFDSRQVARVLRNPPFSWLHPNVTHAHMRTVQHCLVVEFSQLHMIIHWSNIRAKTKIWKKNVHNWVKSINDASMRYGDSSFNFWKSEIRWTKSMNIYVSPWVKCLVCLRGWHITYRDTLDTWCCSTIRMSAMNGALVRPYVSPMNRLYIYA